MGCVNAVLQYAHCGQGLAPVVRNHWAPRFLNSHSEYFIHKQVSHDINQKNAYQPESIRAWFQKYYDICEPYNIHQGDKYNFEETSFRMGNAYDQ